MKTYIGLFILVLVLVAASGCTAQQAKPAATVTELTTTVAAPEVPTEIKTTHATAAPIKVTTAVATPVVSAPEIMAATPRPSQTPSTKVTTIHITNNTFIPSELTVLPGTGITWINDDAAIHIVKATGNSTGKFTSSDMVRDAHFMYTFGELPGTYEFGDPKYPDMKGTIFVVKGDSLVGD